MKLFNKVRGTMEVVPNAEVNRDTVYIRSNIIRIDTEDFKGFEYDEMQYKKDEYTELLQEQIDTGKETNNFLGMLLIEKDTQVMGLQNSSESLGSQVVQMDIRLMMGGM
ncbi:hypothetical protein [Clostridium sp.]|uniref:hypothetical protein n=1 Tax=Clostridium sp. TaxID=1506 RepID=UPI001A3942CE|nr:hypothetical protein [Clostridium sp.]MBK5239844.1 hypothetical protein [Clostridium sp.]